MSEPENPYSLGRVIDELAPTYEVFLEDAAISDSLVLDVIEMRFESSVDMADKLSITLNNSDNRYTDSSAFQPGREISIWAGFGTAMGHVGRAEIVRHLPVWSEDGADVLPLVGYDRSYRLGISEATAELEIKKAASTTAKKAAKDEAKTGETWKGSYGQIVTELYGRYGITAKVDKRYFSENPPGPALQRKGTSDGAFLQALARLAGAEAFTTYEPFDADPSGRQSRAVDGEIVIEDVPFEAETNGTLFRSRDRGKPLAFRPGRWVGYFRDPAQASRGPYFEFIRGEGDRSNIISASIDWGALALATEIAVLYFDLSKQEWVELTVADDKANQAPRVRIVKERRVLPKWKYKEAKEARVRAGNLSNEPLMDSELPPDSAPTPRDIMKNLKSGEREYTIRRKIVSPPAGHGLFAPGGPVYGSAGAGEPEITEATPLKIAASGVSIDVVADRRFRSAAEAIRWAEDWFRRYKDSFISLDLTVIGISDLRAGQTHRVSGLGNRYSGDYYFVWVEHRMTTESYTCEIKARKVLA